MFLMACAKSLNFLNDLNEDKVKNTMGDFGCNEIQIDELYQVGKN